MVGSARIRNKDRACSKDEVWNRFVVKPEKIEANAAPVSRICRLCK